MRSLIANPLGLSITGTRINAWCAPIVGALLFLGSSAVSVAGHGTWETTLLGRDLDGDPATFEAYYDTTLDITWLADANYAGTLGYPAGGTMSFYDANAWAAAIDIHGVTGWRLPTVSPIDGTSWNLAYSCNGATDVGYALTTTDGTDGGWRDVSGTPVSEMGHMYYVTLGNLAWQLPNCSGVQPGWGLYNTGPFHNFGHLYWTDTMVLSYGAIFNPRLGGQSYFWLSSPLHFWLVRDGDLFIKVMIDIKPGSDPNAVNLRSTGRISVAILSTDTFDATQVDWATVKFGPNDATESHGRAHVEDVDGDGDMDMLLHFTTRETGIQCGDEEATLTGATFGGQALIGTDAIKTIRCQ